MDWILRHLLYARRSLVHAPGYALVAVLTLALGIGATTAIYAVLERVVLDPLPYPEAKRLVRLVNEVPGVAVGQRWDMATAQYFYFGEHATSFESFGAYFVSGANVEGPTGATRARVVAASASLFELLGATAGIGRLFDERDDVPGGPPVIVLSHGYWREQFGGDPGVVGRTLRLDEQPFEVIGVLAAGTDLPGAPIPTDVWLPAQLDPAGPFFNAHGMPMIGRLAPGATPEGAQAELAALTERLPSAFPDVYTESFFERYGFRTIVLPLKQAVVGDMARNLWLLLGAVGVVLLIAAANVANLFLVRIEGRRRELAVRAALGASRRAIAGHFLVEGLLLALVGGALAVAVGSWGIEWLDATAPAGIPRLEAVGIDGSILLFCLAVSCVVGVALAAIAALRHGRVAGIAALGEGGRGATVGRDRQRVRSTLITAQVALALVLIVGAGLLLESARRLRAVDSGVDAEGVVTMRLFLPMPRYREPAAMWRLYADARARVAALPGVSAAGFATHLPLRSRYGCVVQGFEDRTVYDRLESAELTRCASQVPTSPGYFEALGIPLLAGRTFTAADNHEPARGAVIVSRAFAERFWPGEDPIGKGVGPGGRSIPPFHHVVGVVGDVRSSLDSPPPPAIYYPIVPNPESNGYLPNPAYLVVRTGLDDPLSLVASIRRQVEAVDPLIPVTEVADMRTVIDESMSRLSFMLALLGLAAAVALALAAIGLYGVVSYVVTRRTGEIGVRIALGALPRQVERMVVGDSLRLVGAGLVVGATAALLVTRLMRGLLFGIEPTHPAAYAAAAAVLAGVALVASWLPARRAAAVDPVEALRAE